MIDYASRAYREARRRRKRIETAAHLSHIGWKLVFVLVVVVALLSVYGDAWAQWVMGW